MKNNHSSYPLVASLLLVLPLVSACGANPKRTIFNPANPTMESILAVKGSSVSTYSHTPIERGDAIAHNGTLHPQQNVFRELDNPTLFITIEPHVTKSGTYIPGMTVPYKLYKQVEFALPGEL